MANYKGVSIVFVRKQIQAAGADVEQQLLQRLDPTEQDSYWHTLSSLWLPIPIAQNIIENAVALLYPASSQGFEKLGAARAQDNLNGIYKTLLRVSTVAFVMSQAAKFWSVSYDQGNARAEKVPNHNQGSFIVTGYPELPECFRRLTTGYIGQTLRMTPAKNITVKHDPTNASEWRWNAQWY
jgi:hypothetical protein